MEVALGCERGKSCEIGGGEGGEGGRGKNVEAWSWATREQIEWLVLVGVFQVRDVLMLGWTYLIWALAHISDPIVGLLYGILLGYFLIWAINF